MNKKVVLTAGLVFFSIFGVNAQVKCQATAPSQVAVGQSFQLQYELSEKASRTPNFNLSNFTFLGGPYEQYSSSTSFVNGRISSTSSHNYIYQFRAEKEGTYTIPAASFIVDGKEVKSNSLSIKVVAAQAGSNQRSAPQQGNPRARNQQQATPSISKEDFFIKATVSNSTPYVGEQVIISYKLFLNPNIQGYRVQPTDFPTAKGCWKYELSQWSNNMPQREQLYEGKRYLSIDLPSYAVYPQQSGSHTLSPLALDLAVQVPVQMQTQDDIFSMFFGSSPFSMGSQMVELKIASKSVTITAKETPAQGKPDNYSELVGNFKLSAHLKDTKIAAGEATSILLTISGNGNLQTVEAPQFNFPNAIDSHTPEITDNIKPSLSGVSGSRTFEYLLIPRAEGEYIIPPASFSYFDKAKNTYITLQTEEFQLHVTKGNGNTTAYTSSQATDIQQLGTDIRYIHSTFLPTYSVFAFSYLFWGLLILPIILLAIVLFLFYKKAKNQRNTELYREKKAAKLAQKRLIFAHKLLKLHKTDEFYVEISKVLWGYVSDKFHIPLAQLSFDTAQQKLLDCKMEPQSIQTFLTTLQQCESVRFSSQTDITPDQMYQKTFDFITQIEREIK
ncbi:MAG: BatD family protein [Bacteroidales bacterium]|jgi:cbb3-type cytochrome oxidase subunit 3|nr:BatD family protein [Bacteroidales bacterium]